MAPGLFVQVWVPGVLQVAQDPFLHRIKQGWLAGYGQRWGLRGQQPHIQGPQHGSSSGSDAQAPPSGVSWLHYLHPIPCWLSGPGPLCLIFGKVSPNRP